VLKLSEANFLSFPWLLFKLARIGQTGITSPAFQPSVFAPWTGFDSVTLGKLSYTNKKKGKLYCQFRKQEIRAGDLALRHPKICPQCIVERGTIDALWDINLVTTCPTHGRGLVDRCPHRGNLLSWFRPGVLICRCGAPLDSASGEERSPSVVDLHKKLEQIAFAKMSICNEQQVAVDLGPLRGASLLFLLRFILALGTYRIFGQARSQGSFDDGCSQVVATAAEILSDWPNAFHQLLSSLAKRPVYSNQTRTSVLSSLDDFMLSLYGSSNDTSQCHEVYLEIQRFLASDGYVDPRIARKLPEAEVKPRWVTLSVAAEFLGIDRRTLEKMLERDIIPHRLHKHGRTRESHLVLVDDLNTDFFKPTLLLDVRKAAAYASVVHHK